MVSMTNFDTSLDHARELDRLDPLAGMRDQFHIPRLENGDDEIYFVGNSLGLQPKNVSPFIAEELDKWRELGVRGHFESDYPWLPYHKRLTPTMANIVGGHDDEVVMMNSLTVNLHLMMATFYRPTPARHKILIEQHAFPSDHYAVESQIRQHGFKPQDSLVVMPPNAGSELLNDDQICETIRTRHDELALVLLPGVQYYTGQFLDIAKITDVAREHGVAIGFDLAHAAGNVPLKLHDWNVDFAVWCSYKYLNSGPGSVGGCFVHRRHATNTDLGRLAGWWGQDEATRFEMSDRFNPIPTAEGWQLSNPPILSLAAIAASLEMFSLAGNMEPLHRKSIELTGYFETLLKETVGDAVTIITPPEPARRGCQLSLSIVGKGTDAEAVRERLESAGVRTDWREPNVIRAAPVPMYNSFQDVHNFVTSLANSMAVE